MKVRLYLLLLLMFAAVNAQIVAKAGGIAPEQIFQPTIDWQNAIGTWEVLPEDNPLSEKNRVGEANPHRVIMTLRKDGTCRVFDKARPLGSDGLWTFEDHEMAISFPPGARVDFFVYGIKGDFMVTRSPSKGGKDQLWSKVP